MFNDGINACAVLQYTRVSKKEVGMRMFVPSITHFAFASGADDGADSRMETHSSWERLLVTVDVHKDDVVESSNSLKLWMWDTPRNKYRLSARVGLCFNTC